MKPTVPQHPPAVAACSIPGHEEPCIPPALHAIVPPGQALGMLGSGQLGKMFCLAAQAMGYKTVVFAPEEKAPAYDVATEVVNGAFDDQQALDRFAHRVKAVSTEFENVPAQALSHLAQYVQVRPRAAAVAISQDRIEEKSFIADQGIPVAPHVVIRCTEDLQNPAIDACLPGILKVARLGYDGKGQARVKTRDELQAAFESMNAPCVLEAFLPLKEEVSVLVVRGVDGHVVNYPVAKNVHVDGILASTEVLPAAQNGLCPQINEQAPVLARRIAEKLQYVGVLCVEFFVLTDGRLVVNEMAPRPHNSGHYTQDACFTSQFEQQVRAMTGMPLGSSELLKPCIMLNILGDSWLAAQVQEGREEPDWARVLALPGVSLHLYGKEHAREGRKMGHVNIVGQDLSTLRATARQVAQILHLAHSPE